MKRFLSVSDAPPGFTKARLPFFFDQEMGCDGLNFYLSTANPETVLATHTHINGPSIRFILEGSVTFRRKEYVTGDWIYLPSRRRYGLTAGPRGASFILGYCCCC